MAPNVSRLNKLSQKKPNVATARLILEPSLLRALEEAKGSGNDEQVAELEAQVEEATVTFAFRSIGRPAMNALMDEHPPVDVDRAKAKRLHVDFGDLTWGQSFEPALLAACLIPEEGEEPLTVEDFEALYKSDNWTAPELDTLFITALSVNSSNSIEALGKG
ncbi:UNVERIFIED_CONTAM: hypothetical protein RF653_10020 [Kocuria sp. CPCC 205316]|uniref:hypothetical protein n=1 Tax=Kocuria TaxID=57493 RepID=UPI0036DF3699